MRASGVRYRIDREHPAVRSVLDDAGDLSGRIQSDAPGHRGDSARTEDLARHVRGKRNAAHRICRGTPSSEVQAVLMVLYRNLVVRKGMSPQLAREQLLHTEPFNNCPDLVEALPDDPKEAHDDGVRD